MRYCLLLIFACLYHLGLGQTYQGKQFWLGLLPNQFSPNTIQLMVNSTEAGILTVAAPAQSFQTTYNYGKGTTFISLNKSVVVPSAMAGSVDNKGIEILSSTPIRIKVLNELNFSSDASPLIPYDRILSGDRYIIQSLRGSLPGASSFTIVSPNDNTEVEVKLSAPTVSGFMAGSTFSIILDKGETITVRAKDNEDLSGTTIKAKDSCDRFLVFTGSRCSQSDYNSSTCTGCDHLFSQLVPVSHFGEEFIIMPFQNQPGNYTVKVTAAQDGTDVFIDGINTATLSENESFEYRPIAPFSKKTCLRTSKPSLVYQYMNSSGCNGSSNSKGDPSMLFIPDRTKWTTQTEFGVYNSSNVNEHYINIVAHKKATFTIDADVSYTLSLDSTLMCQDYAVFTLNTIPGQFNIKSDSSFYSYVYSIGNNESFVYLTGAKVYPFKQQILDSLNYAICFDKQPFELSMNNDSLNVNTWIMGDGTIYGSVRTISHFYNQSGLYNAQVLLSRNGLNCVSDSIDIEVEILPQILPISIRDSVLCPDEKIRVSLPEKEHITYVWNDGSVGSIKDFDQVGTYFLQQVDTNGCIQTDSFTLRDSGCFDKSIKLFNVFTPNGDGFNNRWVIEYKGYASLTVVIYNRWGVEVFNGDLLKDEFWDGTLNGNGNACAEGTYFYKIQGVTLRTGRAEEMNGTLTLLR